MTERYPPANEGAACFWRHRWGKWTDMTKGETSTEGRVVGKVIMQERRCERCNRVQLHTAEARINLWT